MNIFCGVVRLSLNSLLWCLWCVMAAPASALPSTSPPAWRSSSSSEICLSPRRSSRLWNGVKSYVIGGSENDQAAWLAQEQAGEVEPLPASFHELSARTANGELLHFSDLKSCVVLCVNVASMCGKTNVWYSELAKLQDDLQAHGLVILCFPCNQFLSQEPKDASSVETCMRPKYKLGPSFRYMEKVDVNGPSAHPVYRWLRINGSENGGPLGWNFCERHAR